MEERVKRLGLWAVTAPPPPELSRFEGDRIADVVVIGGGYTGLSAALHLAESGTDAVLLEAHEIGFGGSGRNVGLVNAGLWMFPEDVVKTLGPDYGERLLSVLGNSPDLVFELIGKHGIACEAIRNGTLHCADSRGGLRQLREREAQWGERGAPVKLLDADTTAEKIGSRAFCGALHDLRAGTVQPLAYAYGLAHAAVKAGAKLYVDSAVTSCERKNGRWKVKTACGTINAKAVIRATGGYPEDADGKVRKTYIPFNYFQFSTPPLPEEVRGTVLPERNGAWDTNLVLSSYRMDAAGRLIVGSVGQVDQLAYRLHRQWVKRTLDKVFPQIRKAVGDIALEYAWHGRIAMTADHIPRFHLPEPDMIQVTSYNGRGIGPGTVFGKLMAEYILNGSEKEIPLPVTKPQPIFLRDLRGLYYETGARMYHLVQRRI